MRAFGFLAALAASSCFAPVGENELATLPDGGSLSSAADAGVPDAGVSSAATFTGLHAPTCGPADGPATQFLLDVKGVSCPANGAALDLELYTSDLTPRVVTVGGGFGGEAFASSCGALECFVGTGTFTIQSSANGVVRGTLDLLFGNGERRQGTFETHLCGADAGMPPPMCG